MGVSFLEVTLSWIQGEQEFETGGAQSESDTYKRCL